MSEVRLERPTEAFQVALNHYMSLYKGKPAPGARKLHKYASDFPGWLKYIKELEKDLKTPSTQFVIVRNKDNAVIGMLDARHTIPSPHLGHIALSIAPTMRSKGYGYQAACLAIDYLYESFGIEDILYTCESENDGACALVQSLGGEYEKTVLWRKKNLYLDRYWIKAKGVE